MSYMKRFAEGAESVLERMTTKGMGGRVMGAVGTSAMLVAGDFVLNPAARPMERAGGWVGMAAGVPVRHAVSRMGLKSAIGKAGLTGLGVAAEIGVFMAVSAGFSTLDRANQADQQRMRQLTTGGWKAAQILGNNNRYILSQRQEAVQAMNSSIFNARSAIGREATFLRNSVDDYL